MLGSLLCSVSRWLAVIMSATDNAMKYRGLEMSKYVNFTMSQALVMVPCASKSSQHHFLEDQLILQNYSAERMKQACITCE